MQLFQHAQRHVYLPLAAVHHDQIRETAEASKLRVFLTLCQAVREPSSQHFLHAGIVVRPLHGLDLKFAVVARLRLALFVDDHGAN